MFLWLTIAFDAGTTDKIVTFTSSVLVCSISLMSTGLQSITTYTFISIDGRYSLITINDLLAPKRCCCCIWVWVLPWFLLPLGFSRSQATPPGSATAPPASCAFCGGCKANGRGSTCSWPAQPQSQPGGFPGLSHSQRGLSSSASAPAEQEVPITPCLMWHRAVPSSCPAAPAALDPWVGLHVHSTAVGVQQVWGNYPTFHTQ